MLQLENCAFGYNKRPVIRDVSMTIGRGEFIGLTGPNGAGKTTLFRGILGLLPPLAGKLTRDPQLKNKIGYVPQRDQLDAIYPVTAFDVVAMGLTGSAPWYSFLNRASKSAVRAGLKHVGLGAAEGHSFSELSGGQRQRVLIARALIIQPLLLVLDEPTSGIDTDSETRIYSLLKEHKKLGMSIFIVSHQTDTLAKHADRILEIRDQGVFEK